MSIFKRFVSEPDPSEKKRQMRLHLKTNSNTAKTCVVGTKMLVRKLSRHMTKKSVCQKGLKKYSNSRNAKHTRTGRASMSLCLRIVQNLQSNIAYTYRITEIKVLRKMIRHTAYAVRRNYFENCILL